MTTDFADAHQRHLTDAKTLYNAQRWANADHLYGLSAECGLKVLMLKFGMEFDTIKNKPTKKEDGVHANKIWDRYESYCSGHPFGTQYVLSSNNPFSDWDVNQRYDHHSNFNQTVVGSHKFGAECVAQLVQQAKFNGFLA